MIQAGPVLVVRTEERFSLMGNVIGQILPLALAITVSPVPIIAVILLLFTDRPKPNGGAFVIGFFLGVTAVLGIFLALASTQDFADSNSTPSTASYWMRIALGVLLLVASYRQLRQRPQPGEEPTQPKWMAGITSFTTGKSVITGLVVGAVNPKNLAMSLAAAATISAAGLSTGDDVGVVLAYAVIASLGVAAPVVVALAMGKKATPVLNEWKHWLSHNNAAVMATLFLIFSVVLIGQGITGLTA